MRISHIFCMSLEALKSNSTELGHYEGMIAQEDRGKKHIMKHFALQRHDFLHLLQILHNLLLKWPDLVILH